MNRVIIDRECKLEVRNSQLIVEDKKVPLRYIDFLYLIGEIEINTKTIMKLLKEDISILIQNRGFGLIYPQKSKNNDLKKKQYFALKKEVDIAREIIRKKIQKSIDNLVKLNKKIVVDFKILDEISSKDSLLGIEGNFAKEYFKEYFSLFDKTLTKGYRSKRPPEDVVNALMSYLYTLLYYEIANRLIFYGFEVGISYLHESFRDHMSLASDLLEVFRSDVDVFVYEMFDNKKVIKKDFTKEKKGIFLRSEKRKEIWSDIKDFFENLKIDEEIAWLRRMIEN
ncbi:CRISPR-associated endonuclease Cas1 [Caminibacter mediatlanticus]|uniref:CRISPR-associated endonuclease Cas1 n=1 Tax=Caminibacter mediatlanticus TB-2 TaxID=391592 RepID=A0AAI9AGL4_9BACT|nr:CRISPR-associated endonuclease Cas1 [Caminibacter mediatlanticus]EDM23137.1 CRISPR-associated protein Cas1/Cas4 [Caminibacter mediatlanticus TB-2]